MLRKQLMTVLSLVMVVSMALAACQATPTPTTAPVQPTSVPATAAPNATATAVPPTATPVPVRNGAWVDTVVFTSIDQADQAVAQLKSGNIDVYAYSVSDPGIFTNVAEDANLTSSTAFGSYTELTFNPSGPEFLDGRLNPFSVAKIREAMNYAIDRNNIVQNIYGGLAKVKFTTLNSAFPDYVRYVDVAREIEAKYAYNIDTAQEIIDAEMETLGATRGTDGKWQYKGSPVVIILIIRTEDERTQIGDYVANQLEALGFTTDRQYKTRTEASPIWNGSNPAEGKMHIYTGGWITTAISRDDGSNFGYFYTPLGSGSPLWQGYVNTPEYFDVAEKLWNNDFNSFEERGELFREAMYLAMEDSTRLWLVDQVSFSPLSANVQVAYDLAGGISGTTLWPHTVQLKGQEGGEVRIAQPGILVEPWNPVAGSNWIYDTMPRRGTEDYGTLNDPYTGLAWPQRIESAAITVAEGLPITKTLDWVTLETSSSIVPPDDAWVDFDATNQVFYTVADAKAAMAVVEDVNAKATELAGAADLTAFNAEAMTALVTEVGALADVTVDPATDWTEQLAAVTALATDDEKKAAIADAAVTFVSGLGGDTFALGSRDFSTAKTKRVVTYPADFWTVSKWHDGSPMTMGDFVLGMILTFDRAKADSAIYDESAVPTYSSFTSIFKGVKVISTDPLVIETYSDGFAFDAELMVSDWYPVYAQGIGAWHNLALGIRAETENLLTFSVDKQTTLQETNEAIEWMSFIAGPSLNILKAQLDDAAGESYIPYAPTMGEFVTADEAAARYANLDAWYAAHDHFWVGTGAFMLDRVFPVEQTLTLTRNADYPDPADKWARFGTPMVAEVTIDGAGQVQAGTEAKFDVYATFEGEAYPEDQVDAVKWLLFDSKGALAASGDAEADGGMYTITLTADQTSKLEAGSNKLEVAFTSKAVSIPTFQSFEFVTTK
jgi:hypothetical protein